MADATTGANPLFLRDEELRRGMELLFHAYRDFTAEPDALLARQGLGRAHHRALYFIGRHPGITLTGLLDILGITKQSLSRVLAALIRQGYVTQRPGPGDRRRKLLTLTESGAALERELSERQRQRLAHAYRAAGAVAVDGFCKVMQGLIDEGAR